MSTESPLLDLIKTKITNEFDANIAAQLFDIIEEEGFDDESIWLDVQNEEESSLKDQIPLKQFKHIQHICTEYHKPKQTQPQLKPKTSKPKPKNKNKNIYINNDITKLKRDYSNWNTKTKQTRDLYLSQCPGLVNNFPEKSFMDAVTLGHDNEIPLISYIADTFNRYRINTFCNSKNKKDISVSDFKNYLPFYRSMDESKQKGTAIHAILSSYHSRFVPKLQFDPKIKFADNIEDIIKYIYAASQMIDGILLEREQNKNMFDAENDIIPFQFDLTIIPKPGANNQNINETFEAVIDVTDSDNESSSEDDEYEPEESYGYGYGNAIKDEIGYIEPRLRKYNIKYESMEIKQDLLKNNASAQLKRKMNEKFKQIRKGRNGRYVMVVDRRDKNSIKDIINNNNNENDNDEKNNELQIQNGDGKSGNNNDKIYIYSPKCEEEKQKQSNSKNNFEKLHQDFIEESLLFKTKKCLIPGFNDDLNDKHLGSDCNNLITLSFHVLSIDIIRCYLYINGWGARFEPIDLVKLLPIYFQKKPPKNSSLFPVDHDKLSALFPLKLKDDKFKAWYETTTKKMKKHSAK